MKSPNNWDGKLQTPSLCPMAGGALISKIYKGLTELERIGLIHGPVSTRLYGAQAAGCNPIVEAVKRGSIDIRPVKPNTIAKSLAIGNPADGYYAAGFIMKTGGGADDVTDQEIRDGIQLLAETEGIFTETAGGVAIGVTKKLVDSREDRPQGHHRDRHHGQRTENAGGRNLPKPQVIDAKIDAFEELVKGVAHVA